MIVIVHKSCSELINGQRCGKPGVQWWLLGNLMHCDCKEHLMSKSNVFKTYEDALAYAAMESL